MTKRTDLAYYCQPTDHVTGKYSNVEFSGVVTKTYWRPDSSHTRFVHVQLDKPIETKSGVHSGICVQYSAKDWCAEYTHIDSINGRSE